MSFLSTLSRSVSRRLGGIRASHTVVRPTSINDDEIAHFSKLSSEWWDEQGEFSFLHKMNPVRMRFIKEKIMEMAREEETPGDEGHSPLKGLNVLDVGCGGGLLSESLARLGANTVGVDASQSNIAVASFHASNDPWLKHASEPPRLTYLNLPAEALLPDPKRFDVVCSMEVLEHVEHPASFLSTCAELLKPGGHLFLSTVSRTPIAYALTVLLAENVFRKVSRGTHTYSKFVKPSELVEFFREYRSPRLDKSSLLSRPWVTTPTSSSYLNRLEAELRGLIYNPFQACWHLAPRDAMGTLQCNYLFWVRKPKD